MKMSIKLVYQYMAIFFNFSPTSNHLHPLQVENCDSYSRLVVDEDDKVKLGLKGLITSIYLYEFIRISTCFLQNDVRERDSKFEQCDTENATARSRRIPRLRLVIYLHVFVIYMSLMSQSTQFFVWRHT